MEKGKTGDYRLLPMSEEDRRDVIDIFNYYVENSHAAFYEERVDYDFFDRFLQMARGYPSVVVRTGEGNTVGFGFIRGYNHPAPAFGRTCEITYFIKEGDTRRGIGTMMLDFLIAKAKGMGIEVVLAAVSSLNDQSLRFHEKHGFRRCGIFQGIGRKKGRDFDVVWMQKRLDS